MVKIITIIRITTTNNNQNSNNNKNNNQNYNYIKDINYSKTKNCNTAVQSEKGVSFRAIKNFHFEKNKEMYFGVFLKPYLRYIMLNNMKFYTCNKSFIIYLMM